MFSRNESFMFAVIAFESYEIFPQSSHSRLNGGL